MSICIMYNVYPGAFDRNAHKTECIECCTVILRAVKVALKINIVSEFTSFLRFLQKKLKQQQQH